MRRKNQNYCIFQCKFEVDVIWWFSFSVPESACCSCRERGGALQKELKSRHPEHSETCWWSSPPVQRMRGTHEKYQTFSVLHESQLGHRWAHLELVVLGTSFCCPLAACKIHEAQLAGAHAPIGQILAFHHDANDEMGTGALYVHPWRKYSGTTAATGQSDTEKHISSHFYEWFLRWSATYWWRTCFTLAAANRINLN